MLRSLVEQPVKIRGRSRGAGAATAQVQPLAWERPHAAGTDEANKEKLVPGAGGDAPREPGDHQHLAGRRHRKQQLQSPGSSGQPCGRRPARSEAQLRGPSTKSHSNEEHESGGRTPDGARVQPGHMLLGDAALPARGRVALGSTPQAPACGSPLHRLPPSPGPNDGLAGILGGCVVHAVEVEPQQDLAPPPGLGVQDLDTGPHPGQRCVGARPAGRGKQLSGAGRGPGRPRHTASLLLDVWAASA